MTIYEFELKNKCLSPSQPDRSTNLILKLFGIFLTALAARQGAPFWFDVLKRVVNLRGSGVNPTEK
jgi:ribosomal protein L18E